LLRPGRFDRQVTVDRPDVRGREQILKVHAKGKPIDESIDFAKLAKLTPGFTGADLANLMNEAALLSARRNKDTISQAEIEEAMERTIAGPERKTRVMTEGERKTIAFHESGHALVGHVLENSDPVHKLLAIRSSFRRRTTTSRRRMACSTRLPSFWRAARQRSSAAATSRQALRTTSSARRRWPARWSPATA
jgi:ATP-dependent Zn protease